MFSQDFVTLLKLKADVIKEMFQQDTVHTWPVPAPCHCLLLEKGLRKNLRFFFINTFYSESMFHQISM